MSKSRIFLYTLALSVFNIIAVTALFVTMEITEFNEKRVPSVKTPIQKNPKPEVKRKVKKRTRRARIPKQPKNPYEPKCVRKIICIRFDPTLCCIPPDVISRPADYDKLKKYYNYDPIYRRWVRKR